MKYKLRNTNVEERPQYMYNIFQKEIKPNVFLPAINNGERLMPVVQSASAYTSL